MKRENRENREKILAEARIARNMMLLADRANSIMKYKIWVANNPDFGEIL